MLYVARTFDMFGGVKELVIRSVIGSVVDNNEIGTHRQSLNFNDEFNINKPFHLGKIYSVMGVLENVSSFIFVPIYTNIYKYTVDSFPNAYFICSFLMATVVTILSGLVCEDVAVEQSKKIKLINCRVLHRFVEPKAEELTSNELSSSQPTNTPNDKKDKLAEPC